MVEADASDTIVGATTWTREQAPPLCILLPTTVHCRKELWCRQQGVAGCETSFRRVEALAGGNWTYIKSSQPLASLLGAHLQFHLHLSSCFPQHQAWCSLWQFHPSETISTPDIILPSGGSHYLYIFQLWKAISRWYSTNVYGSCFFLPVPLYFLRVLF